MKVLSRNRKIAIALIITFIVLTVAFIWSNSCQSAAQSSKSSGAVYSTVQNVLDKVFGEGKVPITHNVIRKLAHFSEFAVLGAEFCVLIIALNKESFTGYVKILPCGVFVAAVDECLQFISDRGPAITDVLIDFFGYLTATVLFFVIFLIRSRIKAKKISGTSAE